MLYILILFHKYVCHSKCDSAVYLLHNKINIYKQAGVQESLAKAVASLESLVSAFDIIYEPFELFTDVRKRN